MNCISFVSNQGVGAEFVFGLLLALSIVVGAVLVANIYTIGNCFVSLAFSQRKHLQRAVAKLDVVKSEGYLQVSKNVYTVRIRIPDVRNSD